MKSLFFRIFSLMLSCQHEEYEQSKYMEQKIDYPFDNRGMVYNNERSEQPVVIRTVHKGSEYVLEIPSDGTDYSLSIPLEQIGRGEAMLAKKERKRMAHITDRELVGEMPRESESTKKSRKLTGNSLRYDKHEGSHHNHLATPRVRWIL